MLNYQRVPTYSICFQHLLAKYTETNQMRTMVLVYESLHDWVISGEMLGFIFHTWSMGDIIHINPSHTLVYKLH